jgi:hypothetical protein
VLSPYLLTAAVALRDLGLRSAYRRNDAQRENQDHR